MVAVSVLRKLFSRAKHPAWAPFFTDTELEGFLNLCLTRIARDGLEPMLHLEAGFLTFGGSTAEVGLHNLSAMCAQAEADEWEKIVDEFFGQILPLVKGEYPELPDDPAGLRIRIVPPADREFEFIVRRELASGLLQCIAYDMPRSAQYVRIEDQERFGLTEDELFETALANVIAFEPIERVPLAEDQVPGLFALRGDSHYAASHILAVEKHVFPIEEPGLVVAVPARNWALAARLEYGQAEDAIRTVSYLAGRMHEDMPGGISPEVYWWRHGEFAHIPTRAMAGAIGIDLPKELKLALSRPGLSN